METIESDQYLPLHEQRAVISRLEDISKEAPLREKIFFAYAAEIGTIANSLIYLLSWRAGFMGYGLFKYGRARIISFTSGFIFPANSYAMNHYANRELTNPYRSESALHYTWKQGLCNQYGILGCLSGPLILTFLFASKMNLLPIPDGMHKPGVREVAAKIFYQRIRRYTKGLALSAAFSTGLMFYVGYASFIQSCNLLAKMGRKTIILKEDVDFAAVGKYSDDKREVPACDRPLEHCYPLVCK